MNAPISAERESASAESEKGADHEEGGTSSETIGVEEGDSVTAEIKSVMVRKRITTNISHAYGIVIAAIPRIRPFASQMAAIAGFDRTAWSGLESSAEACMRAYLIDKRPTVPAGLVGEGKVLRQHLLRGAQYMAYCGVVDEARVAAMPPGIGHEGIANGLMELAALYLDNWDRVEGRLFVTREQVERAEVLAKALHGGVGDRSFDSVAQESEQAFAVLVHNYEECRAALKWLRRHEGDVDSIAPSLHRKRGRRARARVDEPAEQPALESGLAK